MAFSDSLQKMRQLPEGKRRFFMLVSMFVLSFLVLVIAWKSFERNLGTRLGATPQENKKAAQGLLKSLTDDIARIAKGEEPLAQESKINNQETRGATERIFSLARETRRVVKYNASEIYKWVQEVIR